MSVKSIKFKLAIGGSKFSNVRRGLYKTHQVFNEGVRYYQEWLILMRQSDVYRYEDNEPVLVKSAVDCKGDLLRRLRIVQVENTGVESHSDEELLNVMRKLYELLIPSAVGLKGDAASISRKFLSPLAWEGSNGLTGKSKAGAKPTWQTLKGKGLPWKAAYEKWKKQHEDDPAKYVPEQLLNMGLKPFLRVFTESTSDSVQWFPLKERQGVRTWDRDMFQQAIEGMLSWESWNRNLQKEYTKLNDSIKEFESKLAHHQELVELLREVEAEMKSESTGFDSEDPYAHQITTRAIRGWPTIVEKWENLNSKEAQISDYIESIKEVQRKNSRKFGSEPLFKRLSAPALCSFLIAQPAVLVDFAKYNELLRKRAKAKQYAQKTLPDAITHPVWMRFDKLGGNLHDYSFIPAVNLDENHKIIFSSLLMPTNEGIFVETAKITVPLAKSLQFPTGVTKGTLTTTHRTGLVMEVGTETNEPVVRYWDRGYQALLPVDFGGAKVQFDRNHLKKFSTKGVLSSGATGPIFLNVTINVQAPNERDVTKVLSMVRNSDRVILKGTALSKWMVEQPSGRHGLRVMSVDLGVRFGGAISVFEMKSKTELKEEERERLQYSINNAEEWVAVHERSIVLKLPGERMNSEPMDDEVHQAITSLQSEFRFLNRLLQVSQVPQAEREVELEQLLADNHGRGLAETAEQRPNKHFLQQFLYEACLVQSALREQQGLEQSMWEMAVIEGHRKLEHVAETHLKAFRQRRKEYSHRQGVWRREFAGGGLSLTHIRNLTNERKLLIRWSTHARTYGKMQRLPKGQQFAVSLQTHISHVKEDRIKKLADLLVMTARGYRYLNAASRWERTRFEPCDLILFEDLSRYRFKLDRPPSENNQLMNWSHRELLKVVKMQAAVFGIQVGTVLAAYTSRFDAETGAPGQRCKRIHPKDLKASKTPTWLKRYVEEHQLNLDAIQPEQLIPVEGGEWFVSPLGPTSAGGLKCVQADINAAHNLQRRFWHPEFLRVRCRQYKVDDGFVAEPILQSFIDVYKNGIFLSKDGEDYIYQIGAKAKRKHDGKQTTENIVNDEMEKEEWVELSQGGVKNIQLFRDPSGNIRRGRWVNAKIFWSIVQRVVDKALVDRIQAVTSESPHTG